MPDPRNDDQNGGWSATQVEDAFRNIGMLDARLKKVEEKQTALEQQIAVTNAKLNVMIAINLTATISVVTIAITAILHLL
jgi:hypothetical protein